MRDLATSSFIDLYHCNICVVEPSNFSTIETTDAPQSQVVGVVGGVLVAIPVTFMLAGDFITVASWVHDLVLKRTMM